MNNWRATLAFVGMAIFTMFQIMSTDANAFYDEDLQRVLTIHRDNCRDISLCSAPPPTTTAPLSTYVDEFGNVFVELTPTPLNFSPDGSCCQECSCDTATCSLTGTCCPDTLTYLPTVEESEAKRKITCEPGQYRLYDVDNVTMQLAYMMYRKCPDGFADDEVKAKCERPRDVEPQDLSLFIPVTVLSSGQTYQNMFCASCYNIPDNMVTYWDAKVECRRSEFLPGDVSTILTDIARTEDCDVVYDLSADARTDLPKSPLCEVLKNSCNVTGLWATYDPVIEAACHAFTAPFYFDYQSVFCYLCNTNETLPLYCIAKPSLNVIVPFSAILSVPKTEDNRIQSRTEPPPTKQTECRPDQVLDPLKEQCRDVMCLPPRKYINGSCQNTIEALLGMRLGFYIKMTPLNRTIQTDDIVSLAESFKVYLLDLVNTTDTYPSLLFTQMTFKVLTELRHVTMSTAQFIDYLVFYIEIYSDPRYQMDSLAFLDDVTQMHGTTKTIDVIGSNRTEDCKMELAQYSPFQTGLNFNLKYIAGIDGSIAALYWQLNEKMPEMYPFYVALSIITATYACILLDVSDYTLNFVEKGVFVEELDAVFSLNVYFSRQKDGIDNETSQYLCVDAVMPLIRLEADMLGKQTVEGILSLVCVIISLVCLVLSLLTYSLFKVLRTQPGINNMCLIYIFIIFTACQGLFIFFAFICNKRVYMLYVKLVTGQREKSSSGLTVSTKGTTYDTSSKTT